MAHAFYADAERKAERRNRVWYQNNLKNVLQAAKEKQVREIDVSIALADELIRKLDEKVALPVKVPLHELVPAEDDSLMKPIAPEVLDLLYGSTEKGAGAKYLKRRNKDAPEDKYYFRIVTSWDYGWQQKSSKQKARDVNRGRCAILRDTFYRRNNLAPDLPHIAQPSGGEFSICSEYSCNFSS
ncbi:uncharacterized protein LOC142979831 [Anticarsia gemmatalis]|uniref:uncharacterized protein LOC142979831 n=1 Tax=Anticarsia gemmatalis TaxID=129554 RepID=UPI003F76F32E